MLKKLKYNRRRPFLAIRRLQFGECCPKHGRGGAVGHVIILFLDQQSQILVNRVPHTINHGNVLILTSV